MELFAPHVTDGYKPPHRKMYPNGTALVYSNMTARSDRLFTKSPSCSKFWDSKVVQFGIQGALKEIVELWDKSFFQKPKEAVIARYQRRMDNYVGKGRIPTDGMARLHDIGHLPVIVLAIKEGSRVNMNIPLFVVYDTNGEMVDEGSEFYWLVNYLETVLSNMTWKGITAATIAFEYKRVLTYFAAMTGSPRDFVDLQGHDFCYRGMSGMEDGARTGAGHLSSFVGTDTLPAIDYVEDYYGADVTRELVGCSIAATEHAVATANILFRLRNKIRAAKAEGIAHSDIDFAALRLDAEREYILEIITEKNATGAVALVCDSFNFWGVIDTVLPAVKPAIMARQKDEFGLAKVVIRPDSGDPVEVICGVEIHDRATADAMMLKSHEPRFNNNGNPLKVIYFEENDIIYRGVKVTGGSQSRSWVELDNMLKDEGEVDMFQHMTRTLRLEFTKNFPISLHLDVPNFREQLNDVSSATDFLATRGISVMVMDKGLYRMGFQITEHERTTEEKGAIECLWEIFGGTETDMGFKVLDEHIGLIYGDSITVHRTEEIMRRLMAKGFASCNVVLGIGSFTYQLITRDTFGMAVKATACRVNGDVVELYKDPATGASKKSAKGFLVVEKNADGDFVLLQEQELLVSELHEKSGELKPIYMNGDFMNQVTLEGVRADLRSELMVA